MGGSSLVYMFGLINFILVLFQLASGVRFIKISFGFHKNTGIVLFFTATIHGALAVLVS